MSTASRHAKWLRRYYARLHREAAAADPRFRDEADRLCHELAKMWDGPQRGLYEISFGSGQLREMPERPKINTSYLVDLC
jgi:hypothetical protein